MTFIGLTVDDQLYSQGFLLRKCNNSKAWAEADRGEWFVFDSGRRMGLASLVCFDINGKGESTSAAMKGEV
jgi:hypothetical protein